MTLRRWICGLLALTLVLGPLAGVAGVALHDCCRGAKPLYSSPMPCHQHSAASAADSKCKGDCNGDCAGCQHLGAFAIPLFASLPGILPLPVFGRALPPTLIAFVPPIEHRPPRALV